MTAACLEMIRIIRNAYRGNWFFAAYVVCLIYLGIFEKEKRRLIVWPSLFVMVIVCNPVLYRFFYVKTLSYAYWRLLWIIPVVPVLACAIVSIVTLMTHKWQKLVIGIEVVVLVGCLGSWMYQGIPREFRTITNAHKIPQEAIDVSNAVLAQTSDPRVIMPADLYCYTRQYSSHIHQMYGRDIDGFIAPVPGMMIGIDWELKKDQPDMEWIAGMMRENAYDYLVIKPHQKPEDSSMEACGFSFVTEVDGYEIYKVEGIE